jgi:hypothetical protein
MKLGRKFDGEIRDEPVNCRTSLSLDDLADHPVLHLVIYGQASPCNIGRAIYPDFTTWVDHVSTNIS